MGNNAIIIRTVGCHHNNASYDAERIAKRCVDELRANGHSVLSAYVESGGGSMDVANPTVFDQRPLNDPEAYGRAAYERYCNVSDNKSLISGNELPPWEKLNDSIREAWCAAADPSFKRYVRP